MATGFSSDSGNSDEDGSSLGGGAGLDDDSDEDILSQFQSSKMSTGKTKASHGAQPKGGSPKPSPRNSTGKQSPPRAASRDKQQYPFRAKSRSPSPESDRSPRKDSVPEIASRSKQLDPFSTKGRSPSPDSSHLTRKDSEPQKSKNSRPPVPRPRTSSLSDSQSPRSVEPSPRDRPRPSPRLSSLDKPNEPGNESGYHQRHTEKGKSKSRSPSPKPSKSVVGDSPRQSAVDDIFSGLGSSSQKNSAKQGSERRSSPLLKNERSLFDSEAKTKSKNRSTHSTRGTKSNSPLSDLLEGKRNIDLRESTDLDGLLGTESRKAGLERQSKVAARSRSPSPKSGKHSPVKTKQKGGAEKKTGSSNSDKEVADLLLKGDKSSGGKGISKSPDILDILDGTGTGSHGVEWQTRQNPVRRSPGQNSPGIQESRSMDGREPPSKTTKAVTKRSMVKDGKASPKRVSPSSKARENSEMSPLEKLTAGTVQPKKKLLDSDSEEDVGVGRSRQMSPKVSLLDVLDGSPPDAKRQGQRKPVIPLDTEDDEPTVKFTDRRPKGGYESDGSSDLEAELAKAKRVIRPSPMRPQSGRPLSNGRSPLTSTRTLSMDNMNTLDSTAIREAMYGTWRARKTEELKKKKKLEKKKIDEAKKEEQAREEKRADAKASFDAWKGKKDPTLVAKKRETEKKLKEQKEKEDEKQNQKIFASKAYESWKKDKDERIKEGRKKKERLEREKTIVIQEKEEEKQVDAQKAFDSWNADKGKRLKAEARAKREKERELQYTREIQIQEKEENGERAYQQWEDEMEQRKARERKRLRNTKPVSPYPFRPSSNTVPFGR